MALHRDYARSEGTMGESLTIEEFGKELLRVNDLDPVYIVLSKIGLVPDQLKRWLAAYWCFYDCGTACELAEEPSWTKFIEAAASKTFLRGKERRHFRGNAAIEAVGFLCGRHLNPVDFVNYVSRDSDYNAIVQRVQDHPHFGPWIAFKVADMLERVMLVPIEFRREDVFLFSTPREAALMVWREKMKFSEQVSAKPKDPKGAINAVLDYLLSVDWGRPAPPRYDRPIGIQEVETILCKYKSHRNGHYPVGNDIQEIYHSVCRGDGTSWMKDRFRRTILGSFPEYERLFGKLEHETVKETTP